MRYRVCKSFEVESGHMLSRHPGRCRYPHGHSRRVEVVIAAEDLDDRDMVVDFKALKLAVSAFIESFDHAMAINSEDPELARLRGGASGERLIVFEGEDPTTEVMARRIYEHVAEKLSGGGALTDSEGRVFELRAGLVVERVRVSETSSSWAEYGL